MQIKYIDEVIGGITPVIKEFVQSSSDKIKADVATISDLFEPRIKALEDREIFQPIKGKDGLSVTIEDVRPVLEELVAAIPTPKNGEDGKDGLSVTIEDVRPIVDEATKEAFKNYKLPEMPPMPEIDYEAIKQMVDTAVLKAVSAITIPVPRNGEDGRDAIDLEIEPSIDEEKSYQRGVYASHNGGLWRSFERTKGMRGWECIVDGIAQIYVEYDGQRKAVIKIEKSSGSFVEKEMKIPATIGKGVWRDGSYEKGDSVQLSGSTWLALEDTTERPGEGSKSWLLSAKRGGTGKSAYDIARESGFSGTREQWLDSLGKKTTVKI